MTAGPDSARAAILDLYARYAIGMDRADRALFESVWTEDARFVCDELKLDLEGRDAVMAWYDGGPGRAPSLPAAGGSIRSCSNHVILVDGDSATGVAEFVAFRFDGVALAAYAAGFYDDRFVRTSDGWRIAHRLMTATPLVKAPAPVGAS